MALREVNGWGFFGILSFVVLFGIFVVRFASSLSGVPVAGFNPGPTSSADWVIVAIATATMLAFWRFNKRPYKLELDDIIRDQVAWAGFWMALMMGLVALGAIFRFY